jgi:ribosomal-protein-alanine N-acetyltransferase
MMHSQMGMKVKSLHFSISKKDPSQVRPARNHDWLEIERLLNYANRHYLTLEWWTIQEWLGSPTFLLVFDQRGRAMGLMLSVSNEAPVAWLRAVSVLSERYLMPLVQASIQSVLAQGGTGLAFLGNEGWIVSKLRQAGFRQVNQVVTLRRRGARSLHEGPPDLQVRSAISADVDLILAVDHAAFTPLWWYSHEILNRALNLAHSFDVALIEGEFVGYQLSTLRHGRGHIVRLAVHPYWQRRGIGGRLLSEALRALDGDSAESVTVNTQVNNHASLRLYQRFSFEPIGKPLPVWYQSLEQG